LLIKNDANLLLKLVHQRGQVFAIGAWGVYQALFF